MVSRNLVGLVLAMNTDEWRDSAACKGHADLFLAEDTDALWSEMKKICDRCPVRIPCLDFALSHNITDLMWGGLSGKTRKQIRRRSRASDTFRPSLAPDSDAVQASEA